MKNNLTKQAHFSAIVLPSLILFAILFAGHLPIKFSADDIDFANFALNEGIFNRLTFMYATWSSRILVLGLTMAFASANIWVWKIANCLVLVMCYVCIVRLIGSFKDKINVWAAFGCVLFFPLKIMASAGWVTTSINYIWPVAAMLFAFIPIKKLCENASFRWYEYPLYILAALFAANTEITAALMLGFYTVFAIFFAIKKQQSWQMLLYGALSLAQLIFHIICPGNAVRAAQEQVNWFPDFGTYTFVDKLFLALNDTLGYIIGQPNRVYFLLTLVITICVFQNHKYWLYRLIAVVPFVSCVILSIYFVIAKPGAFNLLHNTVNAMNSAIVWKYLPLLCAIFIFGLSLIGTYIAMGNTSQMLICQLCLAAGFASRMVMAVSPTLFASGERTFCAMYLALIFVCIFIIKKIVSNKAFTR